MVPSLACRRAIAALSLLALARQATGLDSPRPVPSSASAAELEAALTPTSRPLLVHVWASWCAPCRAEWPALAEALRRAGGVDVVTLAIDGEETRPEAARVLAAAGRVPGRALAAAASDAFPALKRVDPEWDGALPATYLLDPSGRVVLAQRGVTRLKKLEEAIGALATGPKPRRADPPHRERRDS